MSRPLGLKKPLLVTDKALASLPITKPKRWMCWMPQALAARCFLRLIPNPNEKNMADGIAVYQSWRP